MTYSERNGGRGILRCVPDDFHLIAPGKSCEVLAKHYSASPRTVRRWKKIAHIKGPTVRKPYPVAPHNKIPPPDDLAKMARIMSMTALAGHYGVCKATASRWLRDTGIQAKKVASSFVMTPNLGRGSIIRPTAAYSEADIAADTLRRQRFVVYRCDDKGKQADKGKFWRVGAATVCTDAEIIERAARYDRRAA